MDPTVVFNNRRRGLNVNNGTRKNRNSKKLISDYIVVSSVAGTDRKAFTAQIMAKNTEGYVLQGGISVAHGGVMFQAMVKHA